MSPATSETSRDEVALLTSKPVDADGVSAVVTGTVAWVVLGAVLMLFFRTDLAAHNASWWLWVPLAGTVMGLLALPYVLRRRSVYRRHAATRGESAAPHEGESST